MISQTAWANCTSTVSTTVCDSASPNPYTSAIGASSITLNSGAQIRVDPYAGASFTTTDIALYGTGGQLNAQSGSAIINTYGGTAIAAGANTTVTMNGSITMLNSGTGISLNQNAVLNLGSSGTVTVSGTSSGNSAAVVVTGTGALLNINGTLQSTVSTTSTSTNDAVISMVSRDNFANTVLGTGTINVNATGTVLASGSHTPAIVLTNGSTLNIAGQVSAWDGPAIDDRGAAGGTATINILAGGSVSTHGWAAIVSDSGSMNVTVAGTIDVNGLGTAIQGGSGDDTITLLTGSNVNGVIAGGTGTNTLTMTGSGTGQLLGTSGLTTAAINGGTWTILNRLDPANGITIASGATGIGSASVWGDRINLAGTLDFDQASDQTYSGTLSGTGQLVKSGLYALTLGDQTGFTGSTLVSAGTLVMAGVMPSMVTVGNGGTIAGTGSVGGLWLQSGGTVAPGAASTASGSSVGTLNVAGNFVQAAGSTYAAQVSGNSADKITVTGTASLASGARLSLSTQNVVFGKTYTLLTANGGLSGQYSVVQSDLAYRLTYDADSVLLTFGRTNAQMLALARGANQMGVAQALLSLPNTNSLYSALALAQDDATVTAAYPQLTGDLHGAVRSAMLHSADMLTDTALMRNGTQPGGLRLWGQMLGSTGNSSGLNGAANVSRQSYGGVLGLEKGLGSATLGLAAGYLHSRLAAATGKAGINTPQVLGYGRAALMGLSLQGGVGYLWASNHVSRQVNFTGFSDADQSSYRGDVLHGFGEIGVPVALGGGSVTPFVAGRAYRLATNGFTELGGSTALQGAARTRWSEMTEVGAKLSTPVANAISAQGRIAWQHRYGASQAETLLGFVAGGDRFSVTGADLSRNAASFDLNLGWNGLRGVSVLAGYHGVLGDRGADHSGRLTLALAL